MNIKTLVYIIVGVSVFTGIWIFNIFAGVSLLLGFGLGIVLHDYFNNIFKNYQKRIYLSEKADMENRKKELESELEKLRKDIQVEK